MAKDGMGSILKIGLIGGAAYLAWSSGLLSQVLASIGIGTAAAAPATGTTTGAGTLATGGGGSTSTGAPGSGSGPASANTPATPPPTCAVVNFTCPDGTVLSQTPGNYPACNTSAWNCPVPSATQSAANTTNASDLATALNARALKDGVAQGSTIAPAATGYPNGQVMYTPQQWNFIMRELYPNASVLPSSSSPMTSAAYVLARLQAGPTTNAALGLSGLGGIHRVQVVTGAGMKTLQSRAAAGDLLAAVQLRNVGVPVPRIRPGSQLRLGPVGLRRVAR